MENRNGVVGGLAASIGKVNSRSTQTLQVGWVRRTWCRPGARLMSSDPACAARSSRKIKAAGGDGWFPTWTNINADTMSEARSLGLKIGAWTVDDPAQMHKLATLGIDAICTDRPDVMAGLIGGR